MSSKYKDDLEHENQILKKLLEEREHTEVLIARQRRRIASLSQLISDDAKPSAADDLGLTEACRSAFRNSEKEWLEMSDIMAGLRQIGVPLHTYKNAAASVTTTVARMVTAGEATMVRVTGGGKAYKWIGRK
jgi:hypothetical protein